MAEQISWFATGATILAALVTASNLGARITGYGFVIFLFGSLAWLAVGTLTGQPALLWTNAALTILNIWGIWRWLGRQAKLEEGSEAAFEESAAAPGAALFPASVLTHAAVVDRGGHQVGRSVDAMICSATGRLHYLAVSAGGVGGVGEQLRRVDWRSASFDGEAVKLRMSSEDFAELAEIPKDHWPAQ